MMYTVKVISDASVFKDFLEAKSVIYNLPVGYHLENGLLKR